MLYPNNTYINANFLSGSLAFVPHVGKTRSWAISNAMAFGSKTSRPQGRNSLTTAITPPLQTGGNISARNYAETYLTSSIVATGNMSATLSVVTTMTAQGNVFGNVYAEFNSEASMTCVLKATGNIEANFDILARPSAFDIAQEVWNATTSGYNNVGTMGEKLNDAGSASNPWTEVIESGLTAAEIMRLILSVQVGKSNISGSTVTFRDVGDTKNRVTAAMAGSERDSVTLDGS